MMTDRTEQKLQEGQQHLLDAEKHLKTGFFKWRPDYDSASVSYQNAGLAFKLAKDFEKARAAYEKLAETHYKLGARFHCAKAYEEAGNACKEVKNFSKALAYFDRASDMYLENGTPDTAALCLERAAKMTELVNYEWSIQLYTKAADISENEEESKHRQAAEYTDRIARLQVQNNKLSDAVKSITKECQIYSKIEGAGEMIPRLTCGLVLVHLHIGDPVSAEQAIYAASDYTDCFDGSDEQDALVRMVEAFNEENQEKLDTVILTPMFKFMDNTYAKLARSLRVPGFSSKKTKPTAPGIQPLAPAPQEPISEKIEKHEKAVNDITAATGALMDSAHSMAITTTTKDIPPPQSQPQESDDDIDLT